MKLLAFTGKMGSGKTTACDYLISLGGYVKVNFKDALVEEMKERLPDVLRKLCDLYCFYYDVQRDDDTLVKEYDLDLLFASKPPLMRALMQNYGTEVRRRDDPDYWTKEYVKRVEAAFAQGLHVVTDDCRFLNEAQTVKELGGQIIKIDRADITHTGTHQSEMEMDSINADYIIHTDKGQLVRFYQQIDFILEEKVLAFNTSVDLGV